MYMHSYSRWLAAFLVGVAGEVVIVGLEELASFLVEVVIVVLGALAALWVGEEGEVVTVALEELASFLVEVEGEVVIDVLEVLVSFQDL